MLGPIGWAACGYLLHQDYRIMTIQCPDCPAIKDDELWIYCPRHERKKSRPEIEHCHKRDKYWAAWERQRKNGIKPKQPKPPDEDFEEILEELGEENAEGHSLIKLWFRWQQAIKRWKKAGKPLRTDKEVEAILQICRGCDKYDKRLGLFGKCNGCGCGVNKSAWGSLNKIRMATEKCPDKPPKWLAKVK